MRQRFLLAAAALVAAATPAFAGAGDDARLLAFAEAMAERLNGSAIVAAIAARNLRSAEYGRDDIDRLDAAWRAEAGSPDRPLTASVLRGDAAALLTAMRDESGGLITWAIAMDARGLTVAASDAPPGYWNGEEARWTESFGRGPGAVHIARVAGDAASPRRLAEVSFTIHAPRTGAPIGAVALDVDLDRLE